MAKVKRIGLNTRDIQKAIDDIKEYQKWIDTKSQELLKALANEGMEVASMKFQKAQYDGDNDVSVDIKDSGKNKVAVIATGKATLFIEFGTGIKHPDNHPEAAENGMIRGMYGYGLGHLENGWRYKGNPGTNGEIITSGKHKGEVRTYGNPANMCMYESVKDIEQKFEEIVRRVFK